MPLYIATIAIQVIAAVHLFRTGRDMRWLFAIVFLPVVGSLAYFFVEVLPSLQNNRAARSVLRRARNTVDPNRGVREGALDYERSRNIETASKLADALTKAGRFAEAIKMCRDARIGIFEDDPKILLPQANAEFGAGQYGNAIATLDYLRDKNPGTRSSEGHLIYARALEEHGAPDRALTEYEALARYYPGVQARVRQAMLHKKLGHTEQAAQLFASIQSDARLAPKHFRRSQREWLELAEREAAR
jgi:hypothetical protein